MGFGQSRPGQPLEAFPHCENSHTHRFRCTMPSVVLTSAWTFASSHLARSRTTRVRLRCRNLLCRNLGRRDAYQAPPPTPQARHSRAALSRPRMRGWLHFYAFCDGDRPAASCCAASPRRRPGWTPLLACGVYAVTVCGLFGISALYHRKLWGPRGYARDEAARPLDDLHVHRRHLHAVQPAAAARRTRQRCCSARLDRRPRRGG